MKYKTYKIISESFGGGALGVSSPKSIGIGGSKLDELGVHPDEMDDMENIDGDDEQMDQDEDQLDQDDMNFEDDVDSDMGDDEMSDDDLDFPPDQLDDMHSLAGLDDEEGSEDFDSESGDFSDEDSDEDDRQLALPAPKKPLMPMEARKHMCDDVADDSKHQKEDRKKKYMKKDDDIAKKDDKKSSKKDDGKKKKFCGKSMKPMKENFWHDFLKNAAGTVRKVEFKEDTIIAPESNTEKPKKQGIGNNMSDVETDILGYTALPTFEEWCQAKGLKK